MSWKYSDKKCILNIENLLTRVQSSLRSFIEKPQSQYILKNKKNKLDELVVQVQLLEKTVNELIKQQIK